MPIVLDAIQVGCCVTMSEVTGVQCKEKSRPPESAAVKEASSYTTEQLESYFESIFSISDTNGDGVLQPDEVATLLGLCGSNLSAEEIAQFVSAADTNHNGVIEYSEFVPVASKMLQSQKGTEVRKVAVMWHIFLLLCYGNYVVLILF